MQENKEWQDLIGAKNECLAIGKIVQVEANQRLDQALQQFLPFSRSEIQAFLKKACLALLTTSDLANRLREWQLEVSSDVEFSSLNMSEIDNYRANLMASFGAELQFKAYKAGLKLKTTSSFLCLAPANLALTYQAEPGKMELNIVYEDDYLLVIDKPKGMVVHPAAGNWQGTLLNGLLYYLQPHKAFLVHRIDKDTSGLLVVAKSLQVQQSLQQTLQKHAIKRTYLALAWGKMSEQKFTIKGALARDPANPLKRALVPGGKLAITHAELLEQFARFAYLQLELETGRTHQIRVHLAALDHPLVGDTLYGGESLAEQTEKGQCLHAVKLSFEHPVTKQFMEFKSPLPAYFQHLLALARQGKL